MKNIVIFDDYSERDLKPPALLREYLSLSERDVAAMLGDTPLTDVACPGCASDRPVSAFEKWGVTYRECGCCGTLYVSPRPADEALSRYDATSEARRFWRERLATGTGARREKIVKPRSEWVIDSTREHLPSARVLADLGTAGARHHLPLERIAVQIDDAGQHQQAAGIDVERGAALFGVDCTNVAA